MLRRKEVRRNETEGSQEGREKALQDIRLHLVGQGIGVLLMVLLSFRIKGLVLPIPL